MRLPAQHRFRVDASLDWRRFGCLHIAGQICELSCTARRTVLLLLSCAFSGTQGAVGPLFRYRFKQCKQKAPRQCTYRRSSTDYAAPISAACTRLSIRTLPYKDALMYLLGGTRQ
jgi:hypothetical protein